MPKDFQIREFLCMNRQEVEGMLDKEYNEAEVRELFVEEGRKEGHEEGLDEGISGTVAILKKNGFDDVSIIRNICEQYNISEQRAKEFLT